MKEKHIENEYRLAEQLKQITKLQEENIFLQQKMNIE
jgi:hypothetical protein